MVTIKTLTDKACQPILGILTTHCLFPIVLWMEAQATAHDRKSLGFSPQRFRTPGLIEEWQDIGLLAESLSTELQILLFKKGVSPLWVVLVGGTGTGKSTLFNALCGRPLSETGIERPKTTGPILYAHEGCGIQNAAPFPGMETTIIAASDAELKPTSGAGGSLLVLTHKSEDLSHLIFADTPDLDSVDLANRRVTETLYHLADAVVFVTSQEKYADEVPYLFLRRVLKDRKLHYVILNKAEPASTGQDLVSVLQAAGVTLADSRISLLPYAPSQPSLAIAREPAFKAFRSLIMKELSRAHAPELRKSFFSRYREGLREKLDRLTTLTGKEDRAVQEWLKHLHRIEQQSSEDFIREQSKAASSRTQETLKREIRRLFSKYDLLAKPRRMIRETILAPFRIIGILGKREERDHKEELRRIRQKIDLGPIQAAVDRFNHLALKNLSPAHNEAPLFLKMREPSMSLTPEETKALVWKAQDQLDDWLAKRFEALAASLPAAKRWGIYSTSILWGILLVSLEVAVGGGFTLLDAAVGSALAPFLTKGTVELFAYHEIQKVTRELADRYREGLLSVIRAQRERYEQCLEALRMPSDAKEALPELKRQVAALSGE